MIKKMYFSSKIYAVGTQKNGLTFEHSKQMLKLIVKEIFHYF